MKRLFLFLVFISYLFTSCVKKTDVSDRQMISVSILPQKFMVEQIVGDHYDVHVMIPPGASPVTYDPSPRQFQKLSNSKAYIKIGYLAFEKAWMDKIKSSNPDMAIYDQSASVKLIIDGEHKTHGEGAHQHSHGGVDPHIWTSPKSVKKQVQSILDYVVDMDPENESFYRENCQSFLKQIDSLDHYIEEKFSEIENRSFLIFHPALSYLARDYHLNQIPIEIEGKEPSPQKLRELIQEATEKNIQTILVQEQFNTDNAKAIAHEINGQVITVNPLDYQWIQGMRDITNKLASSMKN